VIISQFNVSWSFCRPDKADPELAALVADLLEEVADMRARLRRAGL